MKAMNGGSSSTDDPDRLAFLSQLVREGALEPGDVEAAKGVFAKVDESQMKQAAALKSGKTEFQLERDAVVVEPEVKRLGASRSRRDSASSQQQQPGGLQQPQESTASSGTWDLFSGLFTSSAKVDSSRQGQKTGSASSTSAGACVGTGTDKAYPHRTGFSAHSQTSVIVPDLRSPCHSVSCHRPMHSPNVIRVLSDLRSQVGSAGCHVGSAECHFAQVLTE